MYVHVKVNTDNRKHIIVRIRESSRNVTKSCYLTYLQETDRKRILLQMDSLECPLCCVVLSDSAAPRNRGPSPCVHESPPRLRHNEIYEIYLIGKLQKNKGEIKLRLSTYMMN